MRILGKTLVAALFSALLLSFIILGTLKFQILNKDFLFSSFKRNDVYNKLPKVLADSLPNDPNLQQEERAGYTEIVKNISPRFTERIIETNFAPFLDFINGESDDIKISIPATELGIPGVGDINWSPSQMQNSESFKPMELMHGLGEKIFIGWTVILFALIGLFFLYGRLTIPQRLLGGKTLLLSGGITITLIGVLGRAFSLLMEKTMPEKLEPSQALLKLLASSLLPEIFITWIIIGVLLLILFLICRKINDSAAV